MSDTLTSIAVLNAFETEKPQRILRQGRENVDDPEWEPLDAGQLLDRLDDWGRGSMNPEFATRMRRELSAPGLWCCVLALIGGPQLYLAVYGETNAEWQIGIALWTLLPAAYVAATIAVAPELPPFQRQAWLISKTVASAIAALGFTTLPLAPVVAVPALLAALVTAGGTALLRHGHVAGSIPAIAIFSVLGVACARVQNWASGASLANHAVALAAFSAAIILVVFSGIAAVRRNVSS
jgi:hypothetical protein